MPTIEIPHKCAECNHSFDAGGRWHRRCYRIQRIDWSTGEQCPTFCEDARSGPTCSYYEPRCKKCNGTGWIYMGLFKKGKVCTCGASSRHR
jgi:hypothetical protein